MRIYLFLIFIYAPIVAHSQSIEWFKTGTHNRDVNGSVKVADFKTDADGNLIVIGNYRPDPKAQFA
ncbi:MAG: hypothetical protein ACXWD4_15910, partial [Bacteroidia bacterium]